MCGQWLKSGADKAKGFNFPVSGRSMVVLGMHQRRFRPLELAGLGLCHTQGVGDGIECCQSQEGFGSESGERGLALE